jgi:hypothetical protein
MEVVTMLSNLATNEVSLVRRGANRKVFAITKSQGGTMNLKAILDTPAEGEEKLVETMKSAGADDKRVAASVAAYRLQKGLADVLKGEDVAAVAKAAGIELPVAKGGGQDEEPGTGTASEDDKPGKPAGLKKAKKSAGELDLSGLTAEDRAQVEAVMKSQASLVEKTAQLEKLVQSISDERTTAAFVAKAEQFKHIPGSSQELGAVLKSAATVDPKLGDALLGIFEKVNGLVAKSALLGSVGVGGVTTPNSAAAKLDALIDGVVQKSAGKVSREKAYSEVLKSAEGKELYREYLAENPAQRARVNY